MQSLGPDEYLLIAEQVIGIPAEQIARVTDAGLLDSALHAPFAGWGDTDLYPTLGEKAGILCSRLARNHPMQGADGNKRAAYLCMLEFIHRNGGTWNRPEPPVETGKRITAVVDGSLDETEFVAWVASHVTEP